MKWSVFGQSFISFWKIPSQIFLLATSLLFLSGPLLQAEQLENKIRSLFVYIENSSGKAAEKARDELVNLGKQALPLVEERFAITQNLNYWFVIEKLRALKSEEENAKNWEKDNYFRKKFQQAKEFQQQGKRRKALELARAILTLEPELSFAEEVKRFYSQVRREPALNLIEVKLVPVKRLLLPKQQAVFHLYLINRSIHPLTIATENKSLLVKVKYYDWDLASNLRVETKKLSLALGEKIFLPRGKRWKGTLRVANPPFEITSYREIKMQVRIPTLAVEQMDKKFYPPLDFVKASLVVIPGDYHLVSKQPWQHFSGALHYSYSHTLFFSSFFLPSSKTKQAISLLIENLGKNPQLDTVMQGILRRWTQQSFVEPYRWKNWWLARQSFFEVPKED